MAIILQLLNLAACAVIWAAAMFFYIRHDRPACARQHFSQVALILIAVGAFAAGVAGLKHPPDSGWSVLFLFGIAMLAAKSLWKAWIQVRARP